MTGIVDALKDHDIFDLLVGGSQEAWEMYCISAQAVLTEHILHEPFDDEDERRAQPLFRRRWDHVNFDHGGNHFQRPLPMLTPGIVEGLGE